MAPPEPPLRARRGGRIFHFLSGLLTFLLIVAVGATFVVYLVQRQFSEPGPLPADKVVVVKGGSQTVAAALEREGVISHPMLFVIGVQLSGDKDAMKAGEYLFKQRASLNEVIDTLVSGKSVLHTITIPEGWTSEQVAQRLRDSDVLVGDIAEVPAEGTLLPDTYKVSRGMGRQQLLARMGQERERVLGEIWSRRASGLPIKTPEEFVVLASIVEKETGRADERPRVAGVFINRLQRKMRLQSDPTIVYGIVGGKGTLGRGILKSEKEKATPYNTYAIDGLPPGPIANPGRAALEAVANPSRTKERLFRGRRHRRPRLRRNARSAPEERREVAPDRSGAPRRSRRSGRSRRGARRCPERSGLRARRSVQERWDRPAAEPGHRQQGQRRRLGCRRRGAAAPPPAGLRRLGGHQEGPPGQQDVRSELAQDRPVAEAVDAALSNGRGLPAPASSL